MAGTENMLDLQVRKILDAKASVRSLMGKAVFTMDKSENTEDTYNIMMQAIGIKDPDIIGDNKDQIITILRQLRAEKEESVQKISLTDNKLNGMMVDMSIIKRPDGTIDVTTFYGFIEANLSYELFWKKWKANTINELFLESYNQMKKLKQTKK
jgi:hypothetical protein